MFAKVQQVSFNYYKFNQKKLRVELYSGLSDAASAGDISPREFGRRLILPSPFTGGPKQMFELYQDCISIGKSLCDFGGMPLPSCDSSPRDQSKVIKDEFEVDVHNQAFIAAETNITLLNPDQYETYNCLMEALTDMSVEQRAFFIDGPGGTRKTFLYNT
ncbi:hypothetical protein LOD99_7839 [Oopsacas minuta]|uniref:Helitron helicase-like domain-containing protein n=1 Tax=Oopsacas minuta TaxID=111878 RepID=A0AAV7JP88_9METZ|nr:hypothetical protein LOD99_7839 [Oopsacas minuta]